MCNIVENNHRLNEWNGPIYFHMTGAFAGSVDIAAVDKTSFHGQIVSNVWFGVVRMMSHLARLFRDERGASMVEYSLLIGLITAATIGLIVAVGGKVTNAWTVLNGNW